MELTQAEKIALALAEDRGEIFGIGGYTLSDVKEAVEMCFSDDAGADIDSVKKQAWIDCGCGLYTDQPNSVNIFAPTPRILEHILEEMGYEVWARCPHLNEHRSRNRYFSCPHCGQQVQGWNASQDIQCCKDQTGHDWEEIDR